MNRWLGLVVGLVGAPQVAEAAAPVHAQEQLLAAPMRGAGDRFGHAIAVDGDFAVIGAPSRTVTYAGAGAFYLLQRAGGTWSVIGTFEETLTSGPSRELGTSLAIGDDLLAVGAPGSGAVGVTYVYAYAKATGWTLQVPVSSPTPTLYSRFGAAVGVSQGQVLVGETPVSLPAMGDMVIGQTHVYDAAQSWAVTQTLTPQDSQIGDRFGYAIAVDGDTAVISAPGKESARGAVYVFTRSAGTWSSAQKLVIAGDRVENDFFGNSVAIVGDRVLIGAYGRFGQLGAAYLFVREGDAWMQTQEITAETPTVTEAFASRVALTAEHAVVSGWGFQAVEGIGGRGGGYLYRGSGELVNLLAALRADDGVPGDLLGVGAALSEQSALLGAPYDDAPTEPVFVSSKAPGSARVFGLQQALGEFCVDDLDCGAGALCCESACTAVAACVGPGSSSGEIEGSSGSGDVPTTGTDVPETSGGPELPGLSFEPGEVGCGCREAPGRGVGMIGMICGLMLLGLRRRRVAGSEVGV
jgi:hypothetical protein